MSVHSASCTAQKRKAILSESSDQTTKVQRLVLTNREQFLSAPLNDKMSMLPTLSKSEIFQILTEERGASLVEAAVQRHPLFNRYLQVLDEEELSELCSRDHHFIGLTLINSCDDEFLHCLLECFKSEKAVKNFFLLENNAKDKADKRDIKNIFTHIKTLPQNKLQLLIAKVFISMDEQCISSICQTALHIPDFLELIAQRPVTGKKIRLLFTIFNNECDPQRSERIFSIIQKDLHSLNEKISIDFLKHNLFKFFEECRSENLKHLLSLINFPEKLTLIKEFLELKDQHGRSFLEKIIIALPATDSENLACLLQHQELALLKQLPVSKKKIDLLFMLLENAVRNGSHLKSADIFSLLQENLNSIAVQIKFSYLEKKIFTVLERFKSKTFTLGYVLSLITFPKNPELTKKLLALKDADGVLFLEKILISLEGASTEIPYQLNFSGILEEDLSELLLIPSTTTPGQSIVFHFVAAIAQEKINLIIFKDNHPSFDYPSPDIAYPIVQFFEKNPELYIDFVKRTCARSMEKFFPLYCILLKASCTERWKKTSSFYLTLKHLTNKEAFDFACAYLHTAEFKANNFKPTFTNMQLDFIKGEIQAKLEEFMHLSFPAFAECFQYTKYLQLFPLYMYSNATAINIMRSEAFKKLINSQEGVFISKYFLFKLIPSLDESNADDSENDDEETVDETIASWVKECAKNLEGREKTELFLTYIKETQPSIRDLSAQEALDIFSEDDFAALDDPVVRAWFAVRLDTAYNSYTHLEHTITQDVSSFIARKEEVLSHILPFLLYLRKSYPDEKKLIVQGCADIDCLFIMIDIEDETDDEVSINDSAEFIIPLFLARLSFYSPREIYTMLHKDIEENETFFLRMLFILSHLSDDKITHFLSRLNKILTKDRFMRLVQFLFSNHKVANPESREKALYSLFVFLEALPLDRKRAFIKIIFLQEAIYPCCQFAPLMYGTSVNNPTLAYKLYLNKNRWMLVNLMRSSLELPHYPDHAPLTFELLYKCSSEMIKKVMTILTESRTNETLTLQQKEELLLPLYYLHEQSEKFKEFFSKYLQENGGTESLLSLFEIHLLCQVLLGEHVPIERYPKIQELVAQENSSVDLRELIVLFKEYNFTDEPSANALDFSEMYGEHCTILARRQTAQNLTIVLPTKKEYKEYLDHLLESFITKDIPNRVAITGFAKEIETRELEYQKLEKDLKIIAAFLIRQNELVAEHHEKERQAKAKIVKIFTLLTSVKEGRATQSELDREIDLIKESLPCSTDLKQLVVLFKEYHFSDEPSANTLDLSEMYREHCAMLREKDPSIPLLTKKEYKEYLDHLLDRFILEDLPKRDHVAGFSQEKERREQEYQKLERDLSIVLSFLFRQKELVAHHYKEAENAKLPCLALLPILASLKENCASRWKGEVEEQLNIIASRSKPHFSQIPALFKELTPYLDFEADPNQPKAEFYKQIHLQIDELFLSINKGSLPGLLGNENQKEYAKIEELLQILTPIIFKQKQLLLDDKSRDSALKQLNFIFSRLLKPFEKREELLEELEGLANKLEAESVEVNPYTKKGKLLVAIRTAYNSRILRLPHSADAHWNHHYKKILWTTFPLLMENEQTVLGEDSLPPYLQNPDGTRRDVRFEDFAHLFFGQRSSATLEAILLKSLNSDDPHGLKKQYTYDAITEDLVFELKKSLIEFRESFQISMTQQQITQFALDTLPILYDDYRLNHAGLTLLLRRSGLKKTADL